MTRFRHGNRLKSKNARLHKKRQRSKIRRYQRNNIRRLPKHIKICHISINDITTDATNGLFAMTQAIGRTHRKRSFPITLTHMETP